MKHHRTGRTIGAAGAAFLVAALGFGGFALAQSSGETVEEHVVTFVTTIQDTDPGPQTVTETETETVVVTETVTVTTPTTGTTPTTTEPEPPGELVCTLANREAWGPTYEPGDCVAGTVITVTNNTQWHCAQPLANYGPLPILVRHVFSGIANYGDQGQIDLVSGCRGDGIDNTVDLIVESNANYTTLGSCGGTAKFRAPPGPNNIQVTGQFNSGPPPCGAAHPDGWQIQSAGPNLDLINGQLGDWDAGTAGTQGAGGSVFFSTTSDVDVYGGEYVSCNHGLFGNIGGAVEAVDAKFRTGRTDGTDPRCTGFAASNPCPTFEARWSTLTCQRWDAANDRWVNQAGYTGTDALATIGAEG